MNSKSLNKNKIILGGASIFVIMMVVLPEVTEEGSKTAIIIWANSIVPVLLPFFIFSDFIKNTGNFQILPPKIYPFVIAFMSGYPMGAKIVGDYIRDNKVSLNEGKKILSYSLVTGPAFIIFTIGSFLGSTKAAFLVAISHYLGAILNKNFYYNSKKSVKTTLSAEKKDDYLENFSYAIGNGFKAMATILAYLMFFTIGINILEHIGAFHYINNQAIVSVLKGIFEMTLGINLVGMCDISLKMKTIIASGLVSFGGLSVIGQSMTMMRNTGMQTKDIIEVKFTHSLISAILATLLVNLVVI